MRKRGKVPNHLQTSSLNKEPTAPVSGNVISSSINSKLSRKLSIVLKDQRNYIRQILSDLAEKNPKDAEIICDFVISQYNELNIKESTKEWYVKVLVLLIKYLGYKDFKDIDKEDILEYLNSLRKSSLEDPTHRSIGNWNNKQIVLLKFFKWIYNPDEPDPSKRQTPLCMIGVKRLPRKEKSPYKPSGLWSSREHEIFLQYCPSKRDKAFHAMANDTSARPHELLNLKINDIKFRISSSGLQYAEITISGKTKPRTVPLISSLPYVKEWIQGHPLGSNGDSWLFVSVSSRNIGSKLTRDGLLKHYQEQYRNRYFPKLLEDNSIPEADKAYIRNLLTKPWNLYIFRHSALTQKSQVLKEHVLRDHAGWSMTSKMPQVYINYFGTESSNSLLKVYGIEKEDQTNQTFTKIPKPCPNCNEPNKPESKFCFKCRMVLTYDAYSETLEEQKKKENEILQLRKEHEESIKMLKDDIEKKFNQILSFIDPGKLN